MKIKKLKLKNFAKFSDFECEFDGKITRLVGVNGSGKTTVGLTAIWACLKGIAEKSKDGQLIGERFRFIGSDKKSADIELTLYDEVKNIEIKVKNHITKSSNNIVFEATNNSNLDDNWLKSLLSVAFLSAKNFSSLSGKEQSLLLGIDTSSFDKKITQIKEDYTIVNRELKSFGVLKAVEPVEKINIQELLSKKDEIESFNRKQRLLNEEKIKLSDAISEREEKIEIMLKEIEDMKETLVAIPMPQEEKSVDEIVNRINEAEYFTQKAYEYEAYVEKAKNIEEKQAEMQAIVDMKQKVEEDRLEYIKTFNFDLSGLSVDDKGSLLLDNKPIREPYFSKGELEVVVAKIYTNLNPELKVRFIDDFELLDSDNQKKLLDMLLEKGFQIITAEVGDTIGQNNTLLLRDCTVADKVDEHIETYGIIVDYENI